MSRQSSLSSVSQKSQRHDHSVAPEIEEVCEPATQKSSITACTTVQKVDVPETSELKYIAPPETRPSNRKSSLPMPETRPPKTRNAQMAFDFNTNACKEVTSHRLNMEERDEFELNQDLKTHFLNIFGEPDPQYHSVACVWTNSYRVFEVTRIYCYKILTLIFALPIAFIAGFLFALCSFLRIWITQPLLILIRMVLSQFLAIWPICMAYIVRPFFYSVGAIFSTFRLHRTEGPIIREIWEKENV